MRKRPAVRNVVEYSLALAALKSLEWTPLPLARRVASGYARLLDLALPRLRRSALRNLSWAMPELSSAGRSAIVDGVFRSIGRVLLGFARLPSIQRGNLDRWIRCEGGEYFEEALRRGRGVLFATAHLGNWELSAFAHALFQGPINVVVRPLDNPLIDRLVERRRGLTGNQPIFKQDSARTILKLWPQPATRP